MQLSEIRKTVIDIATTIVTATPWVLNAEGFLHLSTGEVGAISAVLGVAGWVVHYLTPNVTDDPTRALRVSARLRPNRSSVTKPAGRTAHPKG